MIAGKKQQAKLVRKAREKPNLLLAYAQCEAAMRKITKHGDPKQTRELRSVLDAHGYDPEKYRCIADFLDELLASALDSVKESL